MTTHRDRKQSARKRAKETGKYTKGLKGEATGEIESGETPNPTRKEWCCDHCGKWNAVGTACECGCDEGSWAPISPQYREVLEDEEPAGPTGRNTAFDYIYRDENNWKQAGHVVFGGRISAEEKALLISHLDDGHWFIAEQVGLRNLREEFGLPTEADHCWQEVTDPEGDIYFTDEEPTDSRTIGEFVQLTVGTEWDESLGL